MFASIDKVVLAQLMDEARGNPRRRARIFLHRDHQDPVQEMLIALCAGSYIAPHKQAGLNKSYDVFEGSLQLAFFDDVGRVLEKVAMGPVEGGQPFLCRFDAGRWHTVRALSEIAVFKETIAGPYREGRTEFAAWSPAENDEKLVRRFMESW